ncbi:MAG: TolC family protein, partial [Prevotellaceae bacterium]|nr:TolC family protein [Prevotellaceae bacterium]
GKATITEFNEQKNNLLKAQSDMVQAKYEYLYQTTLLDFYRGENLDL